MWDAAKAVLRWKFIARDAYISKKLKSKINHLSFHLRKLEEEEQVKFKVSRRKAIKIRAGINEIENNKFISRKSVRASLVAQWLRICLPMQGTRV